MYKQDFIFVVHKYNIITNNIIKTYVFTDNKELTSLIKQKCYNKIKLPKNISIDFKKPITVMPIKIRNNGSILELQGDIQNRLNIMLPLQHIFWYDNDKYITTYKILTQKTLSSLFIEYPVDITQAFLLEHKGGELFLDIEEDTTDEETQEEKEERIKDYDDMTKDIENSEIKIKIDRQLFSNNNYKIVPISASKKIQSTTYYIVDLNDLQSIFSTWSDKKDILL